MKRKSIVLIILIFSALVNIKAWNNLRIIDPLNPWYDIPSEISQADLTFHPKGTFIEVGMYLTFATVDNKIDSTVQLEAVYNFDLPANAMITDSWLWIEGEPEKALILDRSPYRDRHMVIAVLTARHGVIRGVLRGVRGGRKANSAAIEVLTLVQFTSHQGPAAEMATFREIEMIRSSYPLASDFAASSAASVVAELLHSFCSEGEAAPRRFRLGSAALDALLGGVQPSLLVSYAQRWMLALSGVFPDVGRCSRCDRPTDGRLVYDDNEGLPLCSGCAPTKPAELEPADLEFLENCAKRRPLDLKFPAPPGVRRWLDLLTKIESDRPMRALSFFRRHAEEANQESRS